MLKEKGRIKTVEGNTQLTLSMEANESCRITDIMVYNPASNYCSLYVERKLAGYYRVGGDRGNHLPFPIQDEENSSLYSYLLGLGIQRPIPVASGETFKIEGVHQSGSVVTIVYDLYDASDVSNTEPNGSQSKTFDYIQYCRYNTTLVDGDNTYDTQQTNNSYPSFPLGRVVPAGSEIKLFGFLFSDVATASGTLANQQRTKFLKLIRELETLYDEDRQGFPYIGTVPGSDGDAFGVGQSIGGDYSTTDERKPYILPEPLVFNEGEDVDLVVTTELVTGSANLSAADTEVGLILRLDRK